MSITYTFEGLAIYDTPGLLGNMVATIDRPIGPIEAGAFNETADWVAAGGRQLVNVTGFGVDPLGDAYFDSDRTDLGDERTLFCDPSSPVTGALWLEDGR